MVLYSGRCDANMSEAVAEMYIAGAGMAGWARVSAELKSDSHVEVR